MHRTRALTLSLAALAVGLIAAPARAQSDPSPWLTVTASVPSVNGAPTITLCTNESIAFPVVVTTPGGDFDLPVYLSASFEGEPAGEAASGERFDDFASAALHRPGLVVDHDIVRAEDPHHRSCAGGHDGGCALVTLVATGATAPGTYRLDIAAAASGAWTGTTTVTVNVMGTPPFRIFAPPGFERVNLAPGGTTSIPLLGGDAGTVYSATITPPTPGLRVTFSDPPAAAYDTLTVSPEARPGSVEMTINATNAAGDIAIFRTVVTFYGPQFPAGTYAVQFHGQQFATTPGTPVDIYDWNGWITFGTPGTVVANPTAQPVSAGHRYIMTEGTPNEEQSLPKNDESTDVLSMVIPTKDPRSFLLVLEWASPGAQPQQEAYSIVFAADGTMLLQGAFPLVNTVFGQGIGKPAN
jgi:hypothetical protein